MKVSNSPAPGASILRDWPIRRKCLLMKASTEFEQWPTRTCSARLSCYVSFTWIFAQIAKPSSLVIFGFADFPCHRHIVTLIWQMKDDSVLPTDSMPLLVKSNGRGALKKRKENFEWWILIMSKLEWIVVGSLTRVGADWWFTDSIVFANENIINPQFSNAISLGRCVATKSLVSSSQTEFSAVEK